MEEFFNRVRKNLKTRAKWAAAASVDSFRVYDRDIPQYPFAVDQFQDWVVVGSFARDPLLFEELSAAETLERLAAALKVEKDKIVLRQRSRKRGDEQYEKISTEGRCIVVKEHGLVFEINLAQYLDVGLFLDHRPLRRFLQGSAGVSQTESRPSWVSGRSCLNLFSYTGTVSVAMLKGGATSVVSVDMSHTYLDWYLRNLQLNGFSGSKIDDAEVSVRPGQGGSRQIKAHEAATIGASAVRADVTSWLRQLSDGERSLRPQFDFIFVDPPSFSNSKKMMGTFDVQRDHPWLLRQCAHLLSPSGVLLFSNNREGFKLAEGVLAEHQSADLTVMSHGCDFSQRPAHRAFAFSRSVEVLGDFVSRLKRLAPSHCR